MEDVAPAEEEVEESRERTPSPVRDIIDEEMAKLLQKKVRLCRVYRSEFQVPEALGSTFGIDGRYRPYPLSRTFVSTNVNDDIQQLANSLIDGIITTAEGNWLLITQIEVYIKDKDIDDVAYISKYDEIHPKLTIKFEKAIEGKSTWCELHIFAQQCLSATSYAFRDMLRSIFSCQPSPNCRMPKNIALEHYQSLPPSYQSICANLISIASKSHTPEAIANLKNSLDSIEFWKDLDLPSHSTNRMVLNRLSEIESRAIKKPSKGKRWLIEAIINHAQGISETTSIQLYNNLLYPSLRLGLIHQTYIYTSHFEAPMQ